MPVTVEQARDEITNNFPAFAEHPHLNDFAAISSYLSGHLDTVKNDIDLLEGRLLTRLTRLAGEGVAMDLRTAAPTYYNNRVVDRENTPKDARYSKLLSSELTEYESSQGFHHARVFSFRGVGDFKRIDILPAALNAETFLNLVRARKHWKDPGVGTHGEYTHRIQWYLVCRTAITIAPVRDIFSAVAGVTTRPPTEQTLPGFKALWDCLVDRSTAMGEFNALDVNDFRCPEYFNQWLTNPAQQDRYPLLHSYLRARTRKRENYNMDAYLLRKLFNTNNEGNLSLLNKWRWDRIKEQINALTYVVDRNS